MVVVDPLVSFSSECFILLSQCNTTSSTFMCVFITLCLYILCARVPMFSSQCEHTRARIRSQGFCFSCFAWRGQRERERETIVPFNEPHHPRRWKVVVYRGEDSARSVRSQRMSQGSSWHFCFCSRRFQSSYMLAARNARRVSS